MSKLSPPVQVSTQDLQDTVAVKSPLIPKADFAQSHEGTYPLITQRLDLRSKNPQLIRTIETITPTMITSADSTMCSPS